MTKLISAPTDHSSSAPRERDAEAVRRDIERAREQLAASAVALRDQMAARTDWRGWVRGRPLTWVAVAFTVGLYLGVRRTR